MNSKHLSIEVFRDYETPEVPTESAEQAVELLIKYTDGIAISSMNRMIKIGTKSTLPEIESIRFPYTSMNSDLNLIVTSRPFESKDPGMVLKGIAQRHTHDGGVKRVAIVSTDKNRNPDITGAHELGHLLNMKSHGETFDGKGHCSLPDCMMHGVRNVPMDDIRIARASVMSNLAKRFQRVQDVVVENRPHENLCNECAYQLGENAFWLLRAKNGMSLPPGYKIC